MNENTESQVDSAAKAILKLSEHIQELILASAAQNHKIDSLENSNAAILEEMKKMQQLVYMGNSHPPMTTTLALLKDKLKTHSNAINWLYGIFAMLFITILGIVIKSFSG